VTIYVNAIELYFHVVLFNTLNKVSVNFKSLDKTLVCDSSTERYIEQYFLMVLFVILYTVVRAFEHILFYFL